MAAVTPSIVSVWGHEEFEDRLSLLKVCQLQVTTTAQLAYACRWLLFGREEDQHQEACDRQVTCGWIDCCHKHAELRLPGVG